MATHGPGEEERIKQDEAERLEKMARDLSEHPQKFRIPFPHKDPSDYIAHDVGAEFEITYRDGSTDAVIKKDGEIIGHVSKCSIDFDAANILPSITLTFHTNMITIKKLTEEDA